MPPRNPPPSGDEGADVYDGEWVECWQCFGNGRLAGCFEDTCVCLGDPEDPDSCCAPDTCDVCLGKCGWEAPQ